MDRMKYKRYWIDKEGNKHLISKMTDSHLLNTVKMLETAAENRASYTYPPDFQGEMAQYYAEQEYNAMQDDPIEFFLSGTVYESLSAELLRRGGHK